uniref:Uncharacterized protein n=1 Tax=Macrostomum lignano TaxID=282301 RepID=A0A1I8FE39_9PLAT
MRAEEEERTGRFRLRLSPRGRDGPSRRRKSGRQKKNADEMKGVQQKLPGPERDRTASMESAGVRCALRGKGSRFAAARQVPQTSFEVLRRAERIFAILTAVRVRWSARNSMGRVATAAGTPSPHWIPRLGQRPHHRRSSRLPVTARRASRCSSWCPTRQRGAAPGGSAEATLHPILQPAAALLQHCGWRGRKRSTSFVALIASCFTTSTCCQRIRSCRNNCPAYPRHISVSIDKFGY